MAAMAAPSCSLLVSWFVSTQLQPVSTLGQGSKHGVALLLQLYGERNVNITFYAD